MSLAEALINAAAKPGTQCRAAKIRDSLEPDDRDTFDAWLASDMSLAVIARALATIGHNIPWQTLRNHRNGACTCEPV